MTKKGCFILVIVMLCMSLYGCDNSSDDTATREASETVTLSSKKEEEMNKEKIGVNNAICNSILKEDPLENITLDKSIVTKEKLNDNSRYSEIVDIDMIKLFVVDNHSYNDKQVLIPVESVEQEGQLVIKNVDLETGEYEKLTFSGKQNDFRYVRVLHSGVRKWNLISSGYGQIWLINIDDKEYYKVNKKKMYRSYMSKQGILYKYREEDDKENSGIYFLNFDTLEEQCLTKTANIRDVYEQGDYLYIGTHEGIIFEYNMQNGKLLEFYDVTEQDDQVSINNIMWFQEGNLYISVFNSDKKVNQLLMVNKDGEWKENSSKTNYGSDYFTLNNNRFCINNNWGNIQIFKFNEDYSMELLKNMHIDVVDYFVYDNSLCLVEKCGQLLQLNQHFEIEKIISPVAARNNPVESYGGINRNILQHENKLIVHSFYDGVYSPLTHEHIDGVEKTFSRDYSEEKNFKLPNENVRVLEENNRFTSVDELYEVSEAIDGFYLDMTYNEESIVYSTHEGQIIKMNRRDKSKSVVGNVHAINLRIDNEKIYYVDVDSAKLYCFDNGEAIPITDKSVYQYEVMDNTIYYTDYLTHQMYRVNLNSVSEVELISKHPVIRLLKYDDDVYFMNSVSGVSCINRISNNNSNQLIHIINNSIGFYFFMDDNKMYYGYDCSIGGGTNISVVDKDIDSINDRIAYSNDNFQIIICDWNGYEFHSQSLTIYDKKRGEIITALTDIYENGGTVIDNYYYISTVHLNYELYRFNLKTGNMQKLISIPHEDKGLQFDEKHSYIVNNNKVIFTYNDEEIVIDLTPFD